MGNANDGRRTSEVVEMLLHVHFWFHSRSHTAFSERWTSVFSVSYDIPRGSARKAAGINQEADWFSYNYLLRKHIASSHRVLATLHFVDSKIVNKQ